MSFLLQKTEKKIATSSGNSVRHSVTTNIPRIDIQAPCAGLGGDRGGGL
jgi:hypothetical protein